MSTIADYLTALITQRNNLAANLTKKGVKSSETETFNSLVPKVLKIQSGGAGGAALSFHPCDKDGETVGSVMPGILERYFESDAQLSEALTKDSFTGCSDNISEVSYIDRLHLKMVLTSIARGEVLSFMAEPEAYRYENGESSLFSEASSLPLSALFGNTEGITYIRTNSKNDSGSDTCTPGFTWQPVRNAITDFTKAKRTATSFSINGDSYIFTENSEQLFQFNRKDAASIYVGYGVFDTDDAGRVLKLLWRGASFYSYSEDQWWELYLLENGDTVLYAKKIGPGSLGTFSYFERVYPTPVAGDIVSFYRKDFYGTDVEIVSGMYKTAHHYAVSDSLIHSASLADIIGSREMTVFCNNNVKIDDGTVTVTPPEEFSWPRNGSALSNIVFSGNSWIGINGTNEDIRLNRRDSSLYTAKLGLFNLADLGLSCMKLIWTGSSHYNGSIDETWELYLFSNGDAMIHLVTLGSSTGGTYTFFGVTYTVSAGESVSFYRTDAAGTAWNVAAGMYDITMHVVDAA